MAVFHVSKAKSTRFSAVVAKTRRLLCTGPVGKNGIRALSRSFGVAEDAGGQLLERVSFVEALASKGVPLDDDDVEAVMYVFDRTGGGTLDPVDFVAALRRDLSPVKLTWIIRVWYIFSQDEKGAVQIGDILNAFQASGHPAVVCGDCSEQDVRSEFEATFNTTTNPDGVITRQEFEQYYSCVAGLCPDDGSFVALLKGVWPSCLPSASVEYSKTETIMQAGCNATFNAYQTASEKKVVNTVRQNIADLDELIRTVHRPSIMAAPLFIRQLSLLLRKRDEKRNFFLSREAFLEALWKQRLYVARPEELLPVLDTLCDGSVDYMLYLLMVVPQLPPARLMMIERVWELFQKDDCGRVDVMEFHKRFKAKDCEEKDAFLAAWDVRCAIQRRSTLEELIEWYTPTSFTIQLDNDFDALLRRQWGLM